MEQAEDSFCGLGSSHSKRLDIMALLGVIKSKSRRMTWKKVMGKT